MAKAIVVIGVSTGGPKTLHRLFGGMPRLDAAVIVVQHMPKFINESIRRGLEKLTPMNARLAENNLPLQEGCIYIAPSEVQTRLVGNRTFKVQGREKVNFVCPAADVTMMSLQHASATRMVGVVLTGLGRDGAEGIHHIKSIGGATLVQDEASSVIWGMPSAALETGAVDHVLPPEQIRDWLASYLAAPVGAGRP